MADGVSDGNGAALGVAKEGEFVEAGGVDNNFKIVDPGFEGDVCNVPCGKAVAAAVVAENIGAAREIANPVAPDGAFPFEIKVIETIGDFDEGKAGADRSVGEANFVGSDAEANFLARGGRRFRRLRGGRGNGLAVRNRREKAITDAGNGFDEGAAAGLFAESFAEGGDVAVEIVLLDGGFRTDCGHEVLFGDKVAAGLDENAKCLESLAGEGDRGAVAEEAMLAQLQPEGAELVDNAGGFPGHGFRKMAEKNQSGQRRSEERRVGKE